MSELSGYKCPTCKGNLRIDKNRVCPHAPHVCISELQSALTEAQEENKRYKLALAVESEFSILYDRYHKKYLAVKLEDEPYIDEHCIDCSFDNCSFGKAGGAVDKSLWQDDLGTAICMAYCKLKGIEVVG